MEAATKRVSIRLSVSAPRPLRQKLGDRLKEAAKAAIQLALTQRRTTEIASGQFTFDDVLLAFSSRTREGRTRVYFSEGVSGVPDFLTSEDEYRRREKEGVERVREERRMGGVKTVRI